MNMIPNRMQSICPWPGWRHNGKSIRHRQRHESAAPAPGRVALNVGAATAALGPTFQFSTRGRKRGEIGIVVHRGQHVCIFGVVLVFRQGTDESNSPNTRAGAGAFDEPQDFIEQKAADRRVSVCHLRHHVYGA